MAERRMFTQKITESDAFIEMPMSSQALYFHLCMNADDDGFVKNPKSIQRLVGCNNDDMKLLIAKRFILPFDSGVIVIKHWRMHNLLRKDRYKETEYLEEKNMLFLKENGAYTFDENQGKPLPKIAQTSTDNQMATDWQPNDNQMAPQYSVGKESIGKDSKEDNTHIGQAMNAFCEKYGIKIDNYNACFINEIDWKLLDSLYSQMTHSLTVEPYCYHLKRLSWITRPENYKKILCKTYIDKQSKPTKQAKHDKSMDILADLCSIYEAEEGKNDTKVRYN